MGRILSLATWFVGLVVAVGVAAWWCNSVAVGLALRWAESRPPLRHGALRRCAAVLLGLWLACAAVFAAVVLVVFRLLHGALGAWLSGTLPATLSQAGYHVVLAGLWLVIVVGTLAGFNEAWGAWGAARRRRFLEDVRTAEQPVALPHPPGTGRRIVILCDGTANRPDETEDGEASATNVWKLAQALVADETQTVFYQAGVGSDTSSTAREARRSQRILAATGQTAGKLGGRLRMLVKIIEAGTGAGISETIVNGYREIVRQYQPGDRIYLVGFSRGAFAARCIAGVISRCGLLRAEHQRFAPDMVRIYRTRPSPDDSVAIRADMAHRAAQGPDGPGVTIECMGLFDTVASLGFPLWGWWFRVSPIWRNGPFAANPLGICRSIHHALAMDERRAQFFPMPFAVDDAASPRVHQVWFRGAHADVGGGYARRDLSDVALGWMADALRRHGLAFRPGQPALARNPLGPPHDELERKPTWQAFGTWPRWHPVPGGTDPVGRSVLHSSVLHRAALVERHIGRRALRRLAPGEQAEFVVNSSRDWFRTGIVVETGACYRITYLGGLTRDGEGPPCGPAGQAARGLDLRRLLGWGRRMPKQRWMALNAIVAHPRAWPPREKPLRAAFGYLLGSAPRPLRGQVARIGRHLGTPGAQVCVRSDAPSGLLHLFMNDWWQTASNNSGGPHLRIARIGAPDAGAPVWHLHEDGAGWTLARG